MNYVKYVECKVLSVKNFFILEILFDDYLLPLSVCTLQSLHRKENTCKTE